MDDLRLAPTLGIVACLAVLGVLGAPYVLADSASGVGTYYGSGAINPLLAGLFALIAIIIFAAGREGRTEPDLAAGVTLTLGLFIVLINLAWALTARVDVVAIQESYRWLLVGVSLGVPVSAAWFTRALGIV
jgi:hypothetical protein